MWFAKAQPNEYLVVARRGLLRNCGVGGRAFMWPGSSSVRVGSTKQEAAFAMTQETRDGIPLRFKGIVIYRVVAPEQTARLFDFVAGSGHGEIQNMLCHVCLGELRALVAGMTMQECIEQRKTTLTGAIARSLAQVVQGQPGGDGQASWGIALDVVQVAQVFIIDDELRGQLEAEVRDQIKAASELSRIRSDDEVKTAQAASARALEQQELASARQRSEIASQKLQLESALQREQLETAAPIRQLKLDQDRALLEQELAVLELETRVKALRAQGDIQQRKAEQELRQAILPQEQVAVIAQALGGMFQGANLAVYGDDARLVGSLAPLVDLLTERLRGAL
ncbi:MAG: hypothetical protein JXR83_12140 [Deltaproteobacteria bacterium]|nr:hypothetical protein [Deltaproteobacteria bacterium]